MQTGPGRIPYTGVPEIAPTPRPPADYQNIQATPQEFGSQVGAAEESLGRSAEETATFYASVAGTQAANDFLSFSDKALYGDPNDPTTPGLMNLHGADAMRAYGGVVDQINKARAQAAAGLNPLAQQEFQRQTMYLSRWALQQAGSHARQQQNAWAGEQGKVQEDLATRNVGLAAQQGDDTALDVLRHQMRDAGVKQLQAKVGTPSMEMIDDSNALQDAKWAQQLVLTNIHANPARAAADLERYKDLLPGGIYNTLTGEVQSQVRRGTVAAAANRALGFPDAVSPSSVDLGGGLRAGGALTGTGDGHVAPKTERIAFAREYAAERGINPDAVVATMNGEGLHEYVGDGGTSFGDLQLHVGGGMGDQALAAGINIRDPHTWKQQLQFAIDQMAENKDKGAAWYAGQWHGAPAWPAASFNRPSGGGGGGAPIGPEPIPVLPETVEPPGRPPPPGNGIEPSPIVPTSSGQPAVQNRTGLPPLMEVWRRISQDPSLPDEQSRLLAFQHAKTFYDAQEADLARSERIAQQQQHAAMVQRENEIYADAYSGQPQIGATQIANDPAFNGDPNRRKAMIDLVNNPPGTGIPTAQSQAAAMDMLRRMKLPPGDPQRINDTTPIYQAATGDLTAGVRPIVNKADFEFLQKQFMDINNPAKAMINSEKGELVKAISPQIDRTPFYKTRMAGMVSFGAEPVDVKGRALLYQFEHDLDSKISAYEKEGKDPRDLLDPANPAYVASPDALKRYQRPMNELLDDIAQQQKEVTETAGGNQDLLRTGSLAALQKAVKEGKITRDAALAAALARVPPLVIPEATQPMAPLQ